MFLVSGYNKKSCLLQSMVGQPVQHLWVLVSGCHRDPEDAGCYGYSVALNMVYFMSSVAAVSVLCYAAESVGQL